MGNIMIHVLSWWSSVVDIDSLEWLADLIDTNSECAHRIINLPEGHQYGTARVFVIWTGDPKVSDLELAGAIMPDSEAIPVG